MARYAAGRLMAALPTLLGITVVAFALVHIMPGSPIAVLVPPDAGPAARQQIIDLYGLNRPLPVQYVLWLWHALHGNLGISMGLQEPVGSLLAQTVGNTAVLALAAAACGLSAGVALGVVAALRAGTWIDRTVSAIGLMGMSVPVFWLAIVLQVIFSIQTHLLPASGMYGTGHSGDPLSLLLHLVMPAVAMGYTSAGVVSRMTRASVLQALEHDYVLTLRAKGLPPRRVLAHVLRNAAPGVMTVAGLELGYLLGASIVVETIFTWPGLGSLMSNAIGMRDLPVIQAGVLLIGTVFVLLNILVDTLNAALDPRLRRAERA